jgi:hypothetical protein
MIAVEVMINGTRTIVTTTIKGGRNTISGLKIVTISGPITRRTSGSGTNIPTGGITFAPAIGCQAEST